MMRILIPSAKRQSSQLHLYVSVMTQSWCGYWCSADQHGPDCDINEPCSIISGQCSVSIHFKLFIIDLINKNHESPSSKAMWALQELAHWAQLFTPLILRQPDRHRTNKMNISTIQPNYYYSHKANPGPLPKGPTAEDERNIVMHNLWKKAHFVINFG